MDCLQRLMCHQICLLLYIVSILEICYILFSLNIKIELRPAGIEYQLETLPQNATNATTYQQSGRKKKVILRYTPYFGDSPWGRTVELSLPNTTNALCPQVNCEITDDVEAIELADAVVFHGRDLPSLREMAVLKKLQKPSQRYVWFIQENPFNTPGNVGHYSKYFDWRMTYRLDSDVPAPYGHYTTLNDVTEPKTKRNYAEGKDKLIAWAVSNCQEFRSGVVRKLQEHVRVDVYGKCRTQFFPRNRHDYDNYERSDCRKGSPECSALLRRYKFYLAFENADCQDYVTEKYWDNAIAHEMVPIVLGKRGYSNETVIPGSYINVLDHPSPKSLADYLLYLDKNDTAYNEYFVWKKKFKALSPEALICNLCAAVNDGKTMTSAKNWTDLGKYWRKDGSCIDVPTLGAGW